MGEFTEFFIGESKCQNWTALWVRSSFMEEEGIFAVACTQGRRELDHILAEKLVRAFFLTREEYGFGEINEDSEGMLSAEEVMSIVAEVCPWLEEEGES